jgi:carboxymethylproline synthase
MILLQRQIKDVLLLQFNHEKSTNPFCDALQDAVMAALDSANKDSTIKSIVLYGGENRSFSAGGDFGEVVDMAEYAVVSKLLGKVVDFYIHILSSDKPIIAAIDNYAIGMGFQVALCSDYRMVSDKAKFIMPELKNGVACTLGGYMLDYCVGRFHNQLICYDGDKLSLDYCKQLGIASQIVAQEILLEKAIEKAQQYADFPSMAFYKTRKSNNKRFIEVLQKARQDTIDDHAAVFASKQHQKHMQNILGKK